MLERFADGSGGFYDTADDRVDAALSALRRQQDPTDNATPAGWSAAAGALLTYAAYTGSAVHREAAEAALGVYGRLADHARFAGWGLAVAEALVDGPREVAVVGPAGDPATAAMHLVALLGTAPGAAVAVGDPDAAPARTRCRCWPTARWSTAGPRRTSAGTSSARRPRPTPTPSPPSCARARPWSKMITVP